jgi:hypothetical protein
LLRPSDSAPRQPKQATTNPLNTHVMIRDTLEPRRSSRPRTTSPIATRINTMPMSVKMNRTPAAAWSGLGGGAV